MKKQIVLALASFIFLLNTKVQAQDESAFDKGTQLLQLVMDFLIYTEHP
ncbi:MAG: hypothetical protein IPL10_01765 [Bacteroidetes bacterium]|nr:hypothetical protein [Bacteroidota bacterium]